MDVCYPFRESFEQNSKPEGVWAGFEEAIQEAQEYERTGQFIVLTSVQEKAQEEESSSESDAPPRRRRTVAKRKRPVHSSDDDANFDDGSDEGGSKKGKRGTTKRLKRGAAGGSKPVKVIRANREQKLFAREIFTFVKEIEKAIKEKQLDHALTLLKKFDPKTVTKRLNKDGLTIDAPGPYAQIETQVVHISRLGRFVHGLAKEHENDVIGPYAQMLYRHLRANARRELALPDDVEAYLANQEHTTPKAKATPSTQPAEASSSSAETAMMTTEDTQTQQTGTDGAKETQTTAETSSAAVPLKEDIPASSGMDITSVSHSANGDASSAMEIAATDDATAQIEVKLEHPGSLPEPMHVDS